MEVRLTQTTRRYAGDAPEDEEGRRVGPSRGRGAISSSATVPTHRLAPREGELHGARVVLTATREARVPPPFRAGSGLRAVRQVEVDVAVP